MKKLLAVTIVTVSTLWAASPASAGPVFDLTATTTLAVNNSGRGTFSPMSMLIGSIELTDAAAMRIMMGMPTSFGTGDIASFQFNVGSLMLSSAAAMGVDFNAVLAADGSTFSLFRLLFTTPMGVGGCDLLCSTEFGRFPTARNAVNIESRSMGAMGGIALDLFSARFQFTARQGGGAQVPEPGTLGLLGLGLLALAARRSRRV